MRPEETNPPPAAAPPASPPAPTPPPQQQANIAELLELAKSFLATQQGAANTAPPPPAETTEPEARQRQKFQRYNPEAAAAAAAEKKENAAAVSAAGGVDPGGALLRDSGSGGGSKRRQRAVPAQLGHATAAPRRFAGRLPFWVSFLTLLGGLALGWFLQPRLSRTVPPAAAPAPPTAAEQNPVSAALVLPPMPPDSLAARAAAPDPTALRALTLVDEAITAEKARDLTKAARLYEEAYNLDPRVPAAARRMAELAIQRGDLTTAITWNNRAFSAGDDLGAAFAQRGILAGRASNLRVALTNFTAAVHAEPQSSRWYFYLAQSLRRSGKLQEAVERLRQAGERAEEPQQEEYFKFISRLTQIELGQTEQIAVETEARLKAPSPPADWVLTAAAIELQRGRPQQAATLMTQVFQNQAPTYAAARLDDVFFRNYETTPALAPLFARYLPQAPGAGAASRQAPSSLLLPQGITPAPSLLTPPAPLAMPTPTAAAAPSSSPTPAPEPAKEGTPNAR